MRNLCYGSGVAYLPARDGESQWLLNQRHDRMRLLARRTGRAPNWREDVSLEDRASALGITLKEPSPGKEAAIMRANKKTVIAKEEAYLATRPVLPPRQANPPPDTPEAMRDAAERALAFERLTGEFALGICGSCMEARLNAKYRKGRGGEKICTRCYADKQWIFTEKTMRSRRGATRMDWCDTTSQALSPGLRLLKSY